MKIGRKNYVSGHRNMDSQWIWLKAPCKGMRHIFIIFNHSLFSIVCYLFTYRSFFSFKWHSQHNKQLIIFSVSVIFKYIIYLNKALVNNHQKAITKNVFLYTLTISFAFGISFCFLWKKILSLRSAT